MSLKLGFSGSLIAGFLLSIPAALAAPAGLPPRCSSLGSPEPGQLCYVGPESGGVRVKPKDEREEKKIIQPMSAEYTIVEVLLDNIQRNGTFKGPTINYLSPQALSEASQSISESLKNVREARNRIETKITLLTGPALVEAKNQLDLLSREEQQLQSQYSSISRAGNDSGKAEIVSWARYHNCGISLFGGYTDTCGSWVLYDAYIIQRYVGSPVRAYERANQIVSQINLAEFQNTSCNNNNIEIRPTSTNLEFRRGQQWDTCSGYRFIFQDDGNLVLYNRSGRAVWATGTNNMADMFAVQTDGNIVLYGEKGSVWASGTSGNSGAFLAVQWDGNVVIYNRDGKPIWSTNTYGR